MFESTGVMTRKELEARNEVKWEMYTKKIQIEARVLGDLTMNHIIPMATKYQSSLIDNVYKMRELFPADKAAHLSSKNMEIIEDIANRTIFIKEKVDEMVNARKIANKIESEREKAIAYHDQIVPMMEPSVTISTSWNWLSMTRYGPCRNTVSFYSSDSLIQTVVFC